MNALIHQIGFHYSRKVRSGITNFKKKNAMKKTLIGVVEMLPDRFYKNLRGLVVLAGTFTVKDAPIVTGRFLLNPM